MFVIGITGGTGAGKTSVLRVIESLGALALDGDEIYHELLSTNTGLMSEIEAWFGGVLKDGVIDRSRLGDIVFSDPDALLRLNAITHKYVCGEFEARLAEWEKKGGKIAAIDAIALVESGFGKRCDFTVAVTAPVEVRVLRIMRRDGLTRGQAKMRINAQKPDSFYEENCDCLLECAYDTPTEFEVKCKKLFEEVISQKTG